ncbi:MAG: efflux RND transporter periplasmic adaptor subunit, partial [Rhodospirillales bacterium]
GEYAAARAEMQLAATNLSYTVVRAPYAGAISRRLVEAGTYVNVGDPLVMLIDDIHLEVEADVPANRIAGLTPGTVVNFRLSGGRQLAATVRAVIPDENPQTRTRTVRFVPESLTAVPNLAANQSVTVQVPASAGGKVVTVHKDAVLNRQGVRLVYVSQNGKAVARPVQLGAAVGSRFVVVTGLKPGDLVIVRGNERLRPGQPVIHDGMAGEGKAPPGTVKKPGADKG